MYENILLAIDSSSYSIRAAEHAIELAKKTEGSKVQLTYVVDYKEMKRGFFGDVKLEDLEEKRREKISDILEIAKSKNVQMTTKFLKGEPHEELIHEANKNDFDLVVMGTRGLTGFNEFVLGSVSHKVIQKAKCPVLAVK